MKRIKRAVSSKLIMRPRYRALSAYIQTDGVDREIGRSLMKKTICGIIVFLMVCMAHTCANAQQQRKSTVVTYYPAPVADYSTIQLSPSNTAPANANPGDMFYNSSSDRIQYKKNGTGWADFGGSGNISTQYLPPEDVFPGTAVIGDVFYNNQTDTIMYLNKTGRWVNLAADPYWSLSALINATAEDPYPHYAVYLTNQTLRRVGVGTSSPEAALHVVKNQTPAAEDEAIAGFYKEYSSDGSGTDMYTIGFTEGSLIVPAAYDYNSSWLYGCHDPSTALKFAALSPDGSISFNAGGYNDSNSEVMRLTNPGGESRPTPRVSIGNPSASMPFALFIDSGQNDTSIFAARGVSAPVSGNLKSGYWNWAPFYGTTANMNYGMYQTSDGIYIDRYNNGTGLNQDGSQIGICEDEGLELRTLGPGFYDASFMKTGGWKLAKTLFNTTGYWQISCARALKNNIVPLDENEMLQKISELDVSRWNYKAEGPSVTHIGPVAEDFYRLFKTGWSEKELPPTESAGVSLAGVKALSAKLNAQQSRIDRLETAIKNLKSKARP
jgi:hypothetical protein